MINNKQLKTQNRLKHFHSMYDPSYIAKQSEKEIAKNKDNSFKVEPSSNTYKAMTLFEFENGMLMSSIMEEQYRTFALDFSRNLQEEFE